MVSSWASSTDLRAPSVKRGTLPSKLRASSRSRPLSRQQSESRTSLQTPDLRASFSAFWPRACTRRNAAAFGLTDAVLHELLSIPPALELAQYPEAVDINVVLTLYRYPGALKRGTFYKRRTLHVQLAENMPLLEPLAQPLALSLHPGCGFLLRMMQQRCSLSMFSSVRFMNSASICVLLMSPVFFLFLLPALLEAALLFELAAFL